MPDDKNKTGENELSLHKLTEELQKRLREGEISEPNVKEMARVVIEEFTRPFFSRFSIPRVIILVCFATIASVVLLWVVMRFAPEVSLVWLTVLFLAALLWVPEVRFALGNVNRLLSLQTWTVIGWGDRLVVRHYSSDG